jgi:translation initiation factor IF-2
MVSINQMLDEKIVTPLCQKMGVKIVIAATAEEQALKGHQEQDNDAVLLPRPPIVTFMGHVDHGKTSLLDAIRKTKVAEGEHGGITQHIGAYSVKLPHGRITFLDTPGHEAFTAMRARGARITDIVVLVVAADDGVMPQTREAIDHAKAANVTLIVAMNKIDKPQANPDLVKKQLSGLGLASEDWGGKTVTVPVSAKTGAGIDQLLEMILLESEMLELRANPNRKARGVVVEAKLSKGRGPVATLLVQNGTLRLNDSIIVGTHYGKIRAMLDAFGHPLREAGPAVPVEILGLEGVPQAGEQFYALDERAAKDMASQRRETERQQQMKTVKRISLEDLHTQIKEGKLKELKLIIKSDVQGSLEAIKDTIAKLNISEVKIEIIHEGVGSINSSDVILAVASDALILGFSVTPDEPAKELIAKEGVDVRSYNIIYELANDIKAAVEGMLEPKFKKTFLGRAEVRKVFRLTKAGTVAGCFVTKGKITRAAPVTLVRNGTKQFEGSIRALKRFKDDVREVLEGFECGISLQGFDALQEGDVLEAYEVQRIAQKL